ncbi:MAG: hypothetical protein JWL86_2594 [Rhizobium sp.]|nr:hypothetical protein [Rhizobium sp.]
MAVLRREVVDDLVTDGDLAAGDFLQPGDHAQKRGFSAACRTDEDEKFSVPDID